MQSNIEFIGATFGYDPLVGKVFILTEYTIFTDVDNYPYIKLKAYEIHNDGNY